MTRKNTLLFFVLALGLTHISKTLDIINKCNDAKATIVYMDKNTDNLKTTSIAPGQVETIDPDFTKSVIWLYAKHRLKGKERIEKTKDIQLPSNTRYLYIDYDTFCIYHPKKIFKKDY